MNVFRRMRASLMLAEAIRRADRAAERTGHRYYVVPDGAGHLVYMDRANFRGLKRKRYISREATTGDLRGDCFYFTASRGGDGMTPRELGEGRERFLGWLRDDERRRKAKGRAGHERKKAKSL
ncbi:MAG: hypothetical protein LUE27_09065 [Clostridia bacterium]|nr:hypothetical protein [Clostridia bacterium]